MDTYVTGSAIKRLREKKGILMKNWIDRIEPRCYIVIMKCLQKQDGKELKSMIVGEAAAD